jgi:hypothetical protein
MAMTTRNRHIADQVVHEYRKLAFLSWEEESHRPDRSHLSAHCPVGSFPGFGAHGFLVGFADRG